MIEETDRLKIHADISPDLNSLSSQHHGGSFSTLRATIGFFTPVGYHCHSGSQELGHLKSVAFAGAWLFEET